LASFMMYVFFCGFLWIGNPKPLSHCVREAFAE